LIPQSRFLVRIRFVVKLVFCMGEGEEGSKREGDSSFKNLHFMEHGRLDSLLGSCSVPGIDFFLPQPVLKNTGTGDCKKSNQPRIVVIKHSFCIYKKKHKSRCLPYKKIRVVKSIVRSRKLI